MNQQTETTNATNARPMRIGRALHMDLNRAKDDDLELAFRVLDTYDNDGKASAWTQLKFDDRIQDIFDEQDRRAGFAPVQITRLPLSHYFPGGADADTDGEGEPDGAPLGEDADGLTPAERAEGREDAEQLRDTFQSTGLVPGLTSAI